MMPPPLMSDQENELVHRIDGGAVILVVGQNQNRFLAQPLAQTELSFRLVPGGRDDFVGRRPGEESGKDVLF